MYGAEKVIAVTVDLIFSLLRNAELNMHHLAHVKNISSEMILRCKLIPTMEQISNHYRQPSLLDSNKEHQTMAPVSLKLWANFMSLVKPLNCSVPQSLQMEKEHDNICLFQDVIKTSLRNVSTFKGQIFCTSEEFIFILSVSWIKVEIFIMFLLFSSANIQ